jgi:hypothetical protein
MSGTNRDIRRYRRDVFGAIPASFKTKRKMLSDLDSAVEGFAADKESIDYDDLVIRFGKPVEVAEAYIADTPYSELIERFSIRKKVIMIVSAAVLMILISWAGIVIYESRKAELNMNTHITVFYEGR